MSRELGEDDMDSDFVDWRFIRACLPESVQLTEEKFLESALRRNSPLRAHFRPLWPLMRVRQWALARLKGSLHEEFLFRLEKVTAARRARKQN
jgi:hypothetical protein